MPKRQRKKYLVDGDPRPAEDIPRKVWPLWCVGKFAGSWTRRGILRMEWIIENPYLITVITLS
jgi:hypothetical protein